jgi:hypothetical protein
LAGKQGESGERKGQVISYSHKLLMLPETIPTLIVYILQVFPADRELLADF